MEDEEFETEVEKFASSASSLDGVQSVEHSKKKKKTTKGKKIIENAPSLQVDAIDGPSQCTEIKGLRQITMTQENAEVIGAKVMTEGNWIKIDKAKVIAVLESQTDSSGLKEELSQMIPSEVSIKLNYTEETSVVFTVALTEESRIDADKQLEEEKRLKKQLQTGTIELTAKPWISLGSENEIHETHSFFSRPLIKMEIEATPERMAKSLTLTDSKVNFVSLGPPRHEFKGVRKTRIDGQVQAVPELTSVNSQTDPGLPVNAWTQYVYDLDEATSQTAARDIPADFKFKELDYLEDALTYNETLNLYTNDYPLLVLRKEDTIIPTIPSLEPCESLVDVKHCASKMPGKIVWHPMCSGLAAVSYINCVRALSSTKSRTLQEYERHYVLIWCIEDALQPRLILMAPREVRDMAWSPTDPNILAGVIEGGQLAIWDLMGRLEAVEAKEVLTRDQTRFRLAIRSLISWSQPLDELKYVQPVTLSSSTYSHEGAGTGLYWLSPFYKFNANGRYEKMPEGQYSLQLMTSGEGGYIMFWDLLPPPDLKAKDSKAKSKGTEQRFSTLNGALKPIYRLVMDKPGAMITSIILEEVPFQYILLEDSKSVQGERLKEALVGEKDRRPLVSLSTHVREIYRAQLTPLTDPPLPQMYVTTEDDELIKIQWEGTDFDKGEDVPTETAEFVSRSSSVHDGPIVSSNRNPFFKELIITAGGHIFAIWADSYRNKPILWKRRKSRITHVFWSIDKCSQFMVLRMDGVLEVWSTLLRTDRPVLEQHVSGEPLTSAGTHVRPLKFGHLVALGDKYNIKLYSLPSQYTDQQEGETLEFWKWVEREVDLRKAYDKWNKNYSLENREAILKRKERKVADDVSGTEILENKTKYVSEDEKRKQRRRNKLLNMTERAAEVAKQEMDDMLNHLLRAKNLDKEELMQKQEPLIRLKQMDEERKIRQARKLAEQEQYYHNTVARLFPDVLETSEETLSEVNEMAKEVAKEVPNYMAEFDRIMEVTAASTKRESFAKKIDFRAEIEEASRRRACLDVPLYLNRERQLRYERRKAERRGKELDEPVPLACSPKTPSLALSRETPQRGTLEDSTSKDF